MQKSEVLTCLAVDCSYNREDICCAAGIEVGDEHPSCDTYTTGSVDIQDSDPDIRDCKVMECHFNRSEACTAGGITLITHSGHADCATYRVY
jgi:hypothetical protein